MAPRSKKTVDVLDQDLLTKEEIAELHTQAQEEHLADRKAKAKKALLAALKKEETAKADPNEEMIDYTITLPRYANFLSVDGSQYFHGETYTFPKKQCDSVRDIVSNAWKHEEAAFGDRDPNAYQRKFNQSVGGGRAPIAMNNHFMRV